MDTKIDFLSAKLKSNDHYRFKMSTTETALLQGTDVEDVPRSELKDYPQDGSIWIWTKTWTGEKKEKLQVYGWIPYSAARSTRTTPPVSESDRWMITTNGIIVRGMTGTTHLVDPDLDLLHGSHLLKVDATDHLKRWKSVLSDLDNVGLNEDVKRLILDYDEESWMYVIAISCAEGYCYLHVTYNSRKECAGGIKLLAQNPLLHVAAEEFGGLSSQRLGLGLRLDVERLPPLALCWNSTDARSLDSTDDEITAARKLWLKT
jgi:hypothetical protein